MAHRHDGGQVPRGRPERRRRGGRGRPLQ
ncbi:hypothetical protein, partial [Achromobacter sp.]